MSTQVDAVIVALVQLFKLAAPLNGVLVFDGPQVTSEALTEVLFVGYDGGSPTEQNEGAAAEQDVATFARGKKEEAEIKCSVVVVSGTTDVASKRSRALAIVSAAEDALRSNMTIGALVQHAFVTSISYIPSQTDKGAKVRVVFTVKYQAQF